MGRRATSGGAWIGIGLETTFGTGVAPTVALEAGSEDIKGKIRKMPSDAIINSRFKKDTYIDGRDPMGSIKDLEANPDNCDLLLAGVLGNEQTVTGGSSPYTHELRPASGAETLPSFSIQKQIDIRTHRYTGMKIDTWNMKAVLHSILKMDFGFLGKSWTNSGLETTAEITTIATVADVAGSLNDTYMYISSPDEDYYIWLNINSGGTDPAIAGRTAIAVTGATGISAADIGAAIATAVNALSDFGATGTETVTVTNANKGDCEKPEDPGSTGFTIAVTTAGVDATPPTYSTKVPWTFSHGAMSIDPTNGDTPVAVYYIQGFESSYSNGIDPEGWVMDGTQLRNRIDKGPATLGLKLDGILDDNAYDAMYTGDIANTDMSLSLLFTSSDAITAGNYYTLELEVLHFKLDGESDPVISGKGNIPFPLNGEAIKVGSDPICKITLVNGDSDKYLD